MSPGPSFRPTPTQELLLAVALGDVGDAPAAWAELRPRFDLERLETGCFALLPLVSRQLAAAGVDDPLLPRLKGIVKSTWTKNALLVERAAATLEALEAAGVRALLVGGVSNALRFYGELGLRPTLAIDLLVEPRGEEVARRVGAGDSVVLRSRLAPETFGDAFPALHAASEPLDLRGTEARVLASTDELFAVCVTGARPMPHPLTQWLADAALVLRTGPVDWDRLVALAGAHGQTLRLREALRCVARLPGAEVPAGVLERLEGSAVARRERVVHVLTCGSVRGAGSLPQALGEHLAAGKPVRELPASLRERWAVDHGWQLPLAAGRRAARVVRGRST